jgi:pimeloyl-ACP methyl ester carboxylesterase
MIPEKQLKKCFELQEEILETLDINKKHYTLTMEELNKRDIIHCKYFHKINKNRKNVIVLLHGFFSSGIGMFKIVKVLMDYFYVVVIDLPGFGLSSRRKVTPNSLNGWLKYFCECKQNVMRLITKSHLPNPLQK